MLKQKIQDKSVKTAIIGLGYVGLPLMNAICNAGLFVLGFDIDPQKVASLNASKSYLDTVPDTIISKHRNNNLFEATTDFSLLKKCDVIIICVPTPLDDHREPDLSYIIKTVETIKANLQKEQLIVLESTTYPGTIKDVVRPLLETETSFKSGTDFYLAFSPEREDPGNPNFETTTIPKVVGADTPHEQDLVRDFYNLFLKKVVPVSSCATAEAVKITENIFRAVNIALVNELKVIFGKMDIDIWEVIEAAKTKPFGYMPFYPGPGLGGHCIPIDPFYLTWKARELEIPTRFIELAGEINTAMPKYVVEQVVEVLNEQKEKSIKGSKILILGVAYKKNINDQRESPAFSVMEHLHKLGAKIDYFDPHVPVVGSMRKYPQFSGLCSLANPENDCANYDLVLLLTDHDDVNYAGIARNASLIIDTRNAFEQRNIKSDKIFKA